MRKLIFLLFFSFIFFINDIKVNSAGESYVICIDPGHGSLDGGSVANGIIEKNINLSISIALKNELEILGYKVILTRDSDETIIPFNKKQDLRKRISIINKNNVTLFLSIHCNIFPNDKYYGAQTFFYGKSNEYLAFLIQNELKNFTNTNRKEKQINDIYLLKNVLPAGVLVECGFLSNEIEANKLKTNAYQVKLAKAISYGVEQYLNLK